MPTVPVLPEESVSGAEHVLLVLQDSGRLLLLVAMSLFLAYVLFLVGSVLLAATLDALRNQRRRISRTHRDVRSTVARSELTSG
jgi:hypothetical protein